MKHVYEFASKIMTGAAAILLFAALATGVTQEVRGDVATPTATSIVTDCSSTSCAACVTNSSGQCVNYAGTQNGSCQSNNDCPDCHCGTDATHPCSCVSN